MEGGLHPHHPGPPHKEPAAQQGGEREKQREATVVWRRLEIYLEISQYHFSVHVGRHCSQLRPRLCSDPRTWSCCRRGRGRVGATSSSRRPVPLGLPRRFEGCPNSATQRGGGVRRRRRGEGRREASEAPGAGRDQERAALPQPLARAAAGGGGGSAAPSLPPQRLSHILPVIEVAKRRFAAGT